MHKIKKQDLDKIFIIGGRSIYKLFFDYADYLHITKVKLINKDINEFFPFDMNEIRLSFTLKLQKELSDEASYTLWGKLK